MVTYHYSDGNGSQITENLFVQQHAQANTKRNIKALHYEPFVGRIQMADGFSLQRTSNAGNVPVA